MNIEEDWPESPLTSKYKITGVCDDFGANIEFKTPDYSTRIGRIIVTKVQGTSFPLFLISSINVSPTFRFTGAGTYMIKCIREKLRLNTDNRYLTCHVSPQPDSHIRYTCHFYNKNNVYMSLDQIRLYKSPDELISNHEAVMNSLEPLEKKNVLIIENRFLFPFTIIDNRIFLSNIEVFDTNILFVSKPPYKHIIPLQLRHINEHWQLCKADTPTSIPGEPLDTYYGVMY